MASVVTVEQINEFIARDFSGSASRCTEVGGGWALARHEAQPENLRPGEIISGPTVFGVCDAALYYACFTVLGIEPMAVTSELSIRFLRPAKGTVVFARASLDQVGRRSIIGTMRAWTADEAKPVAVAQGTYARPTSA